MTDDTPREDDSRSEEIRARLERARELEEKEDFEAALHEWGELREINHDSVNFALGWARVLQAMGRHEEAVDAFGDVLSISRDHGNTPIMFDVTK